MLFAHTAMIGGAFKIEDNLVVDRSPDGSTTVRFTPVSAVRTPFAVDDLIGRYQTAVAARVHHPVLLSGLFILDLLVIPPSMTATAEWLAASLPQSLASLRLDAIATDGKAGIAYEFAVGRRSLQADNKVQKLRELRRATHSIPGWSFELIIMPEPPSALLPFGAIDARTEAIRSILAPDAENPDNDVLLDGMFLMAFTVFESCVATLAFEYEIDYQPLAVSLGTALTEEGVLGQEQLNEIRRYQDKRNKIVHGVSEARATREETLALLDLSAEIRELMDRRRTS
jgi:hypothetical protein